MEIAEIRREKLRQYIKQNYKTRAEFADAIGKSPAQVAMWFMKSDGKRDIGEKLAREIEAALGLPNCWMDVLHDNEAMRVINEDDETMLKLAKMMLPVSTPHSNAYLQRIIEGLEQNQVSDTEKKELEVILKVIAERFFPKGAL